jgi:hypothetical protein
MRKLLSISSLFVLVPVCALAQTTTPGSSQSIEDVRTDYRVHAGPFYVNPAIQLKELGIDTNVFNQAGEQKSDFTFTVMPKAEVAIPFARRVLLKSTVGTDLVYYAQYGSERSIDPEVTVRGEAYANRLTLFAEGAYLNTRQRPSYEIDLRSRHVQNDLAAGGAIRITPKFSIEVAGHRGETRYDADAFFLGTSLRETLNRDTSGYSVIARQKLSPLTTLSVRYENQQDRFTYSPVRDTNSFRVMPGVEFKPKALISGSAFVGYRRFTPESSNLPEYSGLVAQLGLSYTLLGATTFGVTYDRDVNYSFEVLTPYYIDNGAGVFIRRAIGGRFDVLANAARHRYNYQNLTVQLASPTNLVERIDTTDNVGANLGYRMKRDTRVGFGVSYWTRESTVELLRNYDGLRIGTTVTYGF